MAALDTCEHSSSFTFPSLPIAVPFKVAQVVVLDFLGWEVLAFGPSASLLLHLVSGRK